MKNDLWALNFRKGNEQQQKYIEALIEKYIIRLRLQVTLKIIRDILK